MKKSIGIPLFLFFLSCVAPIRDLTRIQYLNKDIDIVSFKTEGVALFPVLAGKGQEGYRRPLGDSLNIYLPSAFPGSPHLNWQQTMEILNNRNKVDDYEKLIHGYKTTSILNRRRIIELNQALNVRYGLFCFLDDYSKIRGVEYNPLVGRPVPIDVGRVSAHVLLIDLKRGDVLQEIIGETFAKTDGFSVLLEGYEKFIGILAKSVLSKIPGSSVIAPKLPSIYENSDDDDEFDG